MPQQNFWFYLFDGLSNIVQAVLLRFLPASTVNPAIGGIATIAYLGIAPILYFVGPFISLKLFATVIGSMLALEAVRLIYAAWRLILRAIPAAN